MASRDRLHLDPDEPTSDVVDKLWELALLTHLNAAMYAFGAYLAIRDGANTPTSRASFCAKAAWTWRRKEKDLRQCLQVLADRGMFAGPLLETGGNR